MYSFDGRIRYSETDVAGRLTLKSLMDYFQDCSVFHSESVGGGWEVLGRDHAAWLLAAWQVRVHGRPSLGDAVTVSTWPVNVDGRVAAREFTMEAADGTLLAEADSMWLYYRFDEGRSARVPDSETERYAPECGARLDLPRTRLSIRARGEGEPAAPTTVTEHLLDTNRHVNNAYYVELARLAAGMGDDVSRVEASYRTPAVLGDVIRPVVHAEEGAAVVELGDGADVLYATVRLEAEGSDARGA